MLVSVNVRVIVTTYEAVLMERCGPDLTRLAAEPEGPAGRLGRFRPPTGPSDPRPDQPADRPLITEAEIGFRRIAGGAAAPVLTARALEDTRLRYGLQREGDLAIDPARLLFSSLGGGGAFTPGDAHCRVITAWDVKAREDWLKARIELRFPVYLGFATFGPGQPPRPPAGRRLGARADLPFLTYRFDSEPIATSALELEAAGPLAGLADGENRPWLERLLADHALALVRNSADLHRQRDDNRLYSTPMASALICWTSRPRASGPMSSSACIRAIGAERFRPTPTTGRRPSSPSTPSVRGPGAQPGDRPVPDREPARQARHVTGAGRAFCSGPATRSKRTVPAAAGRQRWTGQSSAKNYGALLGPVIALVGFLFVVRQLRLNRASLVRRRLS